MSKRPPNPGEQSEHEQSLEAEGSDAPSVSDQTMAQPPVDETLARPVPMRSPPSASDETLVNSPSSGADLNESASPGQDQTLVRSSGDNAGAGKTLVRPPDDAAETRVRPPTEQAPTMHPANPSDIARQAALADSSEAFSGQPRPFGDYDLLSVVAKGGMGVVYKARQRNLNRVVAIKMILAGQLADSTDIGRFYAEAEAAANLRHPNIVGIYEIGQVDGQHFFSMEYIEGSGLDEFVRKSPLEPRRAAEYVQTIAKAMQFAHDQGILHRDLKPSNVLIDRAGVPLLTDFGLAKRVESQSQLTMTGTIIGTPSYMPPEQARGDIEKIDASSDVYSTGAILYELLTGVPPFRAANPFETIRQVLSSEPAPPRVVNPTVPKDLETICLKCLDKEPAARYVTEQELVDELARFLAGEPILARPIGRIARGWRWCRRNPTVAALTAATALFFLLALVGTSIGYVRATAAKRESDRSFRDSRATVDELFTRVSEDDLLNQPGMQPLRRELLQRALAYYQKFLRQRGHDPSILEELASTYFRIGYITSELEAPDEALPWFQRALPIQQAAVRRQPTIEALAALGDTWNQMGVTYHRCRNRKQAAEAYTEAISVRRQVFAEALQRIEHQRKLANSLMNMGIVLKELKDVDQARQHMSNAQRIRASVLAEIEASQTSEAVSRLRRDDAQGFYNLALLEWQAGDAEAANANFEFAEKRFAKLLEEEPNGLWNQWRASTCLRLRADLNSSQLTENGAEPTSDGSPTPYDLVVAKYETAREMLNRLAMRNPEVVDYQQAIGQLLMNLGTVQQRFAKDEDALESLTQAVAVLETLCERQVNDTQHRRDLAVTRCELGVQLALAHHLDEARQQVNDSIELLRQLVAEAQDSNSFTRELARTDQVRQWILSLQPPKPDRRQPQPQGANPKETPADSILQESPLEKSTRQ